MKAIVYTRYGPPEVLELKEIEKPTPKDNEILVRIHATSLNAYDWHLMRADPFIIRLGGGFNKPQYPILGADIAGIVEAVGANVQQFQPGDEVYGDTSACGNGGLAEYAAVPEKLLVLKPTNYSFEQAAAVPMAGITALQGIRDYGKVQPGQKVLIQGASGGVGTFAVQFAKYYGAEVTVVCSTGKMEQARNLGADHVIDYTKEDFTKSNQRYELILAVNGYHSLVAYKHSLAPKGIYGMAGGTNAQIFQGMLGPLLSIRGDKKMGIVATKSSQKDLLFLKELIEAGKIVTVIDRIYPLSEVREAMRYLEEGHAKGKVVIKIV
jgi:NADPH:quinone reductase-like Zn-dependent oxidoreductase